MTRHPEAGFTLIETLIALSVLALSSLAFLGATEAHVVRIGALEYRTAALWAAQNHLAELALGLQPEAQAVLLGIQLEVTVQSQATADPDLTRVDIAVATAVDAKVQARLTGFVAEPGPAP